MYGGFIKHSGDTDFNRSFTNLQSKNFIAYLCLDNASDAAENVSLTMYFDHGDDPQLQTCSVPT